MSFKRDKRRHERHWQNKINRNAEKKTDLEIQMADTSPASMREMEKILQEAEAAGVETIVKTYKSDLNTNTVMYECDPNFHSGMAAQLRNPDRERFGTPPRNIANSLLNIAGYKSHVGPMAPPLTIDDRPLIDLLHEATFTNPIGMGSIKDLYELRMILRKAHCFTLNDATSAMIADFSMATAYDLEASRQMAIPPFPVTWIEINNHARLNRMKALNAPLEEDDPNNPPAKRIGWLIHPSPEQSGYYATYVTVLDIGVWIAPMSYWWHTEDPNPDVPAQTDTGKLMEWLCFGTAGNVGGYDAFVHPSNLHHHYKQTPAKVLVDAMREMAGELRHIWSFLIALGAGHLGASAQYTAQPKPATAPPIMKNGKPLLPLEHKILHLHLNKKTPAKIIAQSITHHHNRKHDVRAHWRLLKSGRRVPVKSHQRGDERLGRIEKTYHVER